MEFSEYTKEQINAINSVDPSVNLQLIACAGSGKTDVVSARIAMILKTVNGISPSNIIVFTYTEKAAEELKNRIYKHVIEKVGEVNGMAEMFVGTIHSFCLKILQDYTLEYQKFSVLDEVKFSDTGNSFTIKEYFSDKTVGDELWKHNKILLKARNRELKDTDIEFKNVSPEFNEEFKIAGIFIGIYNPEDMTITRVKL